MTFTPADHGRVAPKLPTLGQMGFQAALPKRSQFPFLAAFLDYPGRKAICSRHDPSGSRGFRETESYERAQGLDALQESKFFGWMASGRVLAS